MRLSAKAGRKVGELRWSVRVARNNYKQFGGKPEPSPTLERLGDQDFGEKRPVVTVHSPPTIVKPTQTTAAATGTANIR